MKTVFFSFLTFGPKEDMSIEIFMFISTYLHNLQLFFTTQKCGIFYIGNWKIFFALSLAIRIMVDAFFPGALRTSSNHLETINIPVQGLN